MGSAIKVCTLRIARSWLGTIAAWCRDRVSWSDGELYGVQCMLSSIPDVHVPIRHAVFGTDESICFVQCVEFRLSTSPVSR